MNMTVKCSVCMPGNISSDPNCKKCGGSGFIELGQFTDKQWNDLWENVEEELKEEERRYRGGD